MSSFFYTNPLFAVFASMVMVGAAYELVKFEVPAAGHPPKLETNSPPLLPLPPLLPPAASSSTTRRSRSLSTDSALAGVSAEELL